MMDILKLFIDAQIDKIFILAGIAFIFLAVGGQLGAKIVSDKIRPVAAFIVGTVFLITGICINQAPIIRGVFDSSLFPQPKSHGLPIDWCYHRGGGCGTEKDGAADKFCKGHGFVGGAEDAAVLWNVGPTWIMGGGEKCPEHEGGQCSGFDWIKCKPNSQ